MLSELHLKSNIALANHNVQPKIWREILKTAFLILVIYSYRHSDGETVTSYMIHDDYMTFALITMILLMLIILMCFRLFAAIKAVTTATTTTPLRVLLLSATGHALPAISLYLHDR